MAMAYTQAGKKVENKMGALSLRFEALLQGRDDGKFSLDESDIESMWGLYDLIGAYLALHKAL